MNVIDSIRMVKRMLNKDTIIFMLYTNDGSIQSKLMCSILWTKDGGFKIRKYFQDEFDVNMLLLNIKFIDKIHNMLDIPIELWNSITFNLCCDKEHTEDIINRLVIGGSEYEKVRSNK